MITFCRPAFIFAIFHLTSKFIGVFAEKFCVILHFIWITLFSGKGKLSKYILFSFWIPRYYFEEDSTLRNTFVISRGWRRRRVWVFRILLCGKTETYCAISNLFPPISNFRRRYIVLKVFLDRQSKEILIQIQSLSLNN